MTTTWIATVTGAAGFAVGLLSSIGAGIYFFGKIVQKLDIVHDTQIKQGEKYDLKFNEIESDVSFVKETAIKYTGVMGDLARKYEELDQRTRRASA